ncbi:hypothetical protein B0T21DRAFT_367003 [Apiosordaria backusii]|uniref:Uncharacterized protein n=1 Tax=Apiosordaria backusii TaxID=314023 RepID=A0AA40BLK8_9PEZI|nr:hypothetical protein B0T21DRAFT_367003 [Apiosordaria backusii]
MDARFGMGETRFDLWPLDWFCNYWWKTALGTGSGVLGELIINKELQVRPFRSYR